jgi:two-component system KDP operon response regulator KdpE
MSSAPVKVLVVDNDAVIRRTLRGPLAAHGYAVEEARTGEEAIGGASRGQPDLVLLDIDMPGMGGIETCRRLRALLPHTGVVMITVCEREEEKIRALEAGADDYLTKPFSIRELLARLQAITRRLGSAPEQVLLRIGDLELDTYHRTLRKAGTTIRLSPIEFDLLSYLMQHPNVPIEHAKLLRSVWGIEYGSELEYLRTYIKRLRQKIETDATHPEYLITVPWLGYCLNEPASKQPSVVETSNAASLL